MKQMMGSHRSSNTRIEKGDGIVGLFVGYVELISDNKARTLERTMLVTYPIHETFQSFG